MRLIARGPDIPERLIRAHEDGNVVFFCGAGVSAPAGLGNFGWLVDELYRRLGRGKTGAELTANNQSQYDSQLTLLERDISGGRQTLRSHLPAMLAANTRKKGALATHKALLDLAKDGTDRTRIVTTNYDRLFVSAAKSLRHYGAPHLPSPKRSRWDGVVYLHGLMDKSASFDNLNSLVLTSGDFGLAYLTERWASRFVSELFAKYTVCFVGYSADDVVLRYMLDALSSDELQGEEAIEVFAFASASQGCEQNITDKWKVKGVTAIPYDPSNHHEALHSTLITWASMYRDGLNGRQGVALREARLAPDRLTDSGSVDRLLWALNEPSGNVAKAFATAEPPPAIEWLEVFSERAFGRADLKSFGIDTSQIPESNRPGDAIRFSLLHHPSAPSYAEWSSLVTYGERYGGLDMATRWLVIWICRHLNSPETIFWLAQEGGRPHPLLKSEIELAIKRGDVYEPFKSIWQIVVAGYSGVPTGRMNFHAWIASTPTRDINAVQKRILAELLRPIVRLERPFSLSDSPDTRGKKPARVSDVVKWEVELVGGSPGDVFDNFRSTKSRHLFLSHCLPMFTESLLTCMELMKHLGGANDEDDLSVWHQPSISNHEQNGRHNQWTTLIELCRDGWGSAAKFDRALALEEFRRWKRAPYLVFQRLAMHAATHPIVKISEAVELLIEKDALWKENCKREVIQLLMYLAPKVNRLQRAKLLSSIVAGPPRKLYKKNLEAGMWNFIRDRSIWVRLKKWRDAGGSMPEYAKEALRRLETANPKWAQENRDQLEFRVWMSSGFGDVDSRVILPRSLEKLVPALQVRKSGYFETDDWTSLCESESELAKNALKELARQNIWPEDTWSDAINSSCSAESPLLTFIEFSHVLLTAPDSFLHDVKHSLPWWLRLQAPGVSRDVADDFLNVCMRMISVAGREPTSETDDVVGQALNHPVGRTIDAVIRYWYSTGPRPGVGIPTEIQRILESVCDENVVAFVPGLVRVAAQAASLYATDPNWAKEHLLPYLQWSRSITASGAAWEGYLSSPRIDRQLFEELFAAFTTSIERYNQLGKYKAQFASLFLWTTMEIADESEAVHLANSLDTLPVDGVAAAANALANFIANRGDGLTEYLTNRVRRVFPTAWPTSASKRSRDEAKAIATFCVRTGDQFPLWVVNSRPFLSPLNDIHMVALELATTNACAKFPDSALELLGRIVSDTPYFSSKLRTCVEQIGSAKPSLRSKASFKRLMEISTGPL